MDQPDQRSLTVIPFVVLAASGLALAGSQDGNSASGFPIFAISIILAFAIQWAAFIPAYINQTEKLYDLIGSITHVTVTTIAVVLSPKDDTRSYFLLFLIGIWAMRLGIFLFRRIMAAGADRRFDTIKSSFARFLLAWTLQGLWISFTLAAALAAITSKTETELDLFAGVGFLIWLVGFGVEVMADWQKARFRANPENSDRFINTGLWSWSRHPNYFGEIVLWIGIAIIAFPALHAWQYLTLISPVFVTVLLTRISGVPLLEAHADKKWGGQPEYEEYKARTSVIIPRPPRPSSD